MSYNILNVVYKNINFISKDLKISFVNIDANLNCLTLEKRKVTVTTEEYFSKM